MVGERHRRGYRRGGYANSARYPVIGLTEVEMIAIEDACDATGLNRTDFGRVALLAMARTVREHDALAGLRDMVGQVVDEWRNTGPDDPRPALAALTTAIAPGVASEPLQDVRLGRQQVGDPLTAAGGCAA